MREWREGWSSVTMMGCFWKTSLRRWWSNEVWWGRSGATWPQHKGLMAFIGPLRVKQRKATTMQFVSRLEAQVKGGLDWRCFQRRLKPKWHQGRMPAPTSMHSCPGLQPATTLTRSQPFLANIHWPGTLAENLMIHICSLSFEQVNVYFLILPELGGQVSGRKYVTRCLWSGWGTGAYG